MDVARRVVNSLKYRTTVVADRVVPTRRAQRSDDRRQQQTLIAFARSLGDEVRSGPFRGMTLADDASWGTRTPYILGSYEAELHDVIEEIVAMEPSVVVDIGSADGYYAVGLARRLPRSRIVASDTDPAARKFCDVNANNNGVGAAVETRPGLRHAELSDIIDGATSTVVICDCEGCELELLDPDLVPGIRTSFMLIELHDFVDPSISAQIYARFTPTHNIEVVDAVPRSADAYPDVPPQFFQWATDEHRPTDPHPMQWAVCRPRPPAP